MIQPHNRHISISLYISALAVTDTVDLLLGKSPLQVVGMQMSVSIPNI